MSLELVRFRNHCRRMAEVSDLPADDRALFARLADEVDDHLDTPTSPDLFGDENPEPYIPTQEGETR